jgi:hypothetical protein
MKTSTSLGICIVHERDAPDDRVMLYIVYYVYICITGMYTCHLYARYIYSI